MTRSALALALLLTATGPLAAQTDGPGQTRLHVPVAPAESLLVTTAGAGEPIVLIPGLFGSAYGYRHLLDLLPAAGYRAVVIEPLGFGGSPRPRSADYSLTAQADRLAAALRRLRLGPAVVVAHAVAASIAFRIAYRNPGLVKAVVALDGGPAEQVTTPGFRRAMRYVPWVKWAGGVKRLRPVIRRDLVAASGDTSWITDEVVQGYTAGAAADLDGTLLALLAMADAREPEPLAPHLDEIRCPVRLVIGTAPRPGGISPEQVALLAARLPQLAIDSVPGAGQYLFEERPAAVVQAIRRTAAATGGGVGLAR